MKAAGGQVDGALNELSQEMGVESPVGKPKAAASAAATPAPANNSRPQSAAINNEKKQKL